MSYLCPVSPVSFKDGCVATVSASAISPKFSCKTAFIAQWYVENAKKVPCEFAVCVLRVAREVCAVCVDFGWCWNLEASVAKNRQEDGEFLCILVIKVLAVGFGFILVKFLVLPFV